ncbi:MAG: cysteine hydrolase family protein [Nitrososphaerales archaeon]
MQTALIVDDILQDFVYGKLKDEKTATIIPPTRKLIASARSVKIPVIYVCDAHLESDPEIKLWGPHAMKGSDAARVVDELKPAKVDYVLEKRVYSSFQGTGLELLLRGLRVDTVIIVGLYTDICVRHSGADAFQRGFKVIIPRDCVYSLYEDNALSIEYLKKMYDAEITTSSALVEKWS